MDHDVAIDHSIPPEVREDHATHTVTFRLQQAGGGTVQFEVSLLYAERLSQRGHDATLSLRTFDATHPRGVQL